MTLPRPRAVLFDLDGTLMDTAPDLHRALNRLLAEHGRPPLPLERVRPYVSRGARGLIEQAFGAPADPALTEALVAAYEHDIAPTTRLFPGMAALLDRLQATDVRWGVVTNKLEHLARRVLDECPERDRLSACRVLVGGDTTSARKPDPMPLLHAAEQIGVPASDTWYVGDAASDIAAGRAAGMVTVAVDWGYVPPGETAADWQADLHVASAGELLNYLEPAV